MANPKGKHSKARTAQRRATWKIKGPTVVSCPKCHEPRLAHCVCGSCGWYAGRQVFAAKKAE